ncbi:uncharacterized protein [Chanodichthys erythropterus]|uniref:uncharacterized protein n=1 Tax=Chanodichthys erythropterus TaxID=933992 RepID=UPI00351EE298
MRNHSSLLLVLLLVDGVFGVDTDVVKIKVSVMERDSVTLHTDLTEIQTDRDLKWKFPDDTSIIARIDRETNRTTVPGNTSFEGRLKLNETTGSLTITNIKTTDSGVYKLKISGKNDFAGKEFIVSVDAGPGCIPGVFSDDGMRKMPLREEESVILHTEITDIPEADVIKWTFGPQDTALVKTDRQNNTIRYNNETFKDRLHLNTQSGDLTVRNISTEVTGQYKVKIIKRTHTLLKIFSVTVVDSCEPSGYTAVVVSGICGAIALAACAAAVFYWKKNKQLRQKYANRDEHRHFSCWGSRGKRGTFRNYLFKKINT